MHDMFMHCIECPARTKPPRVASIVTCRWCDLRVPAKQFQRHLRDYCPNQPIVLADELVCTDRQAIKNKLSDFPPSMSYGFICLPCSRVRSNADYAKEGASTRRRYQIAKRMYGLSREAYEALEADQAGLCAICNQPPSGKDSKTDGLAVDHDHITGKARGLLCHRCNHGIGSFRDNPALLIEAINYLLRFKPVAVVT